MKRYIALILILLTVFALAACADDANASVKPEQTETADEEMVPTYTISAGGLELKYPNKWKEKVTTSVEDDRLCFACGDVKLFDLVFNKDEGFVLGTVIGDEYTVIYVVDYTIESEDEELASMQNDINVILDNLIADYDFEPGVALGKEDTATFNIETSVVTMKYPAKWENKVKVEVLEDKVKFSTDGTPLFDLVFDEYDGYLLGTYKDTPIYVVEYDVTTDEQIAMQDDVNVVLEHLMEDSNFTIK